MLAVAVLATMSAVSLAGQSSNATVVDLPGLLALVGVVLAVVTSAAAQEQATDRFRSEGRPKVVGGSPASIEDGLSIERSTVAENERLNAGW